MEKLLREEYEAIVKAALKEDLGSEGDITTNASIPVKVTVSGKIVSRGDGRIAGIDLAKMAFHLLDNEIEIIENCKDGDDVEEGETILTVCGKARPILSAERTALNFLGKLSGVATSTRNIVRAVQDYRTKILCTRKTTPGFRYLEKYAVRVGGGVNHRMGLYDAVLIKDNHLKVVGSISKAVINIRLALGENVKTEIEVDTIDQLKEALNLKVDRVLLDNMKIPQLKEAVELAKGRALIEASGGVNLENASSIAATGVDFISVGWITHSACSLDLSLELD